LTVLRCNAVSKTVYEWFDLCDTVGCITILYKSGISRKAKLKDISSEIIEELVKKYPRNLKIVIVKLMENYSLKISNKSLQGDSVEKK
jgi:hypothetical protein